MNLYRAAARIEQHNHKQDRIADTQVLGAAGRLDLDIAIRRRRMAYVRRLLQNGPSQLLYLLDIFCEKYSK